MRDRRTIDKIAMVIIVISLLGLVIGLIHIRLVDRKDYSEKTERYAQIQKLILRKQQIEESLEDLDEENHTMLQGVAMEEFVVTELDPQIYTSLYPLMQSYGVKATMAVSEMEFPGAIGKLTLQQFRALIAEGWNYCLYCTDTSDLYTWLDTMAVMLERVGLRLPNVVYFDDGLYSAKLDDVLSSKGINIAVHHGEESLPLMVSEYTDSSVWRLGAGPWNGEDIRDIISSGVSNASNFVLTVDFSSEDGNYNEESFKDLLSFVSRYCNDSGLIIANLYDAHEVYAQKWNSTAESRMAYEAKKQELEISIADIDAQLDVLKNS